MRAWPLIARLSRPALAVAALYAFVLGTYLGAIVPGPLAATAHILCTPDGSDGSAPALPTHHRDCCTPACPGGMSPVPLPVSKMAEWAQRSFALLSWTEPRQARFGAVAPHDTRARGPPVS